MKVPLLDLTRQYKPIKTEIDRAVMGVLESGKFILSDNVESFEREFADYCGMPYAVGCASGTDALKLSLKALGIKEGDKVITTPLTFIATVESIISVGAEPIFVDIDPVTYNMDPENVRVTLKKDKKKKIKAIIPVHIYGQPCDMDDIMALARECRLKVIEDCAQACGAEYKNKKVGSFGDCGAFSFFPSKNLGGYGDGGIITTDSKSVADRLKMLRFHGVKNKYYHVVRGINSRLDEIQAAILRVKLRCIDQWNDARREKASVYNRCFDAAGLNGSVILPEAAPSRKHIYHVYALRTNSRDKLRKYLSDNGVDTGMHYPIPIHLEIVYRDLGYKKGDFPVAEKVCRQVMSLPVFPEIETKELQYVADNIKSYFIKAKR